jgi:hypothetical protein
MDIHEIVLLLFLLVITEVTVWFGLVWFGGCVCMDAWMVSVALPLAIGNVTGHSAICGVLVLGFSRVTGVALLHKKHALMMVMV